MNLSDFQQQLSQSRHRSLCILSGSSTWQIEQLKTLKTDAQTVLWIDGDANLINQPFVDQRFDCLPGKRLKYHLGQEIDGAVLQIENGIDANQLGILSGMIRAGGLLVLLTPRLDWWTLSNPANQRFLNSPLQPSDAFNAFYRHLYQTWRENNCLWLSESPQDTGTHTVTIRQFLPIGKKPSWVSNSTAFKLTAEQTKAVEKIHTVAFGHRKRPFVLSADRGRGKSSALGVAAIELLLQGKSHIVVTASRLDQAAKIFEQARNWLQMPQTAAKIQHVQRVDLTKGWIEFIDSQQERKCLEFLAPDELVLEPTTADVLMVDEAAFLPTTLLTELLKRHHRMVFATTLHGYEGSGRGFEIRFKQTLNELTPDWKQFHLTMPIRWADGDPLEQAINRALLLNLELNPEIKVVQKTNWHECVSETSAQNLLDNPTLLQSTFALLVQAHYQTSPNDLQQLLSAPNLRIWICHQPNNPKQVVGACLAIHEGQIDGRAKHQQQHGHLVPQLLSRFYHRPVILPLKGIRVMRIAVHPAVQQNGVGSALIEQLLQNAQVEKIDYVSSSFGVNPSLFCFWQKHRFQAVHLGVKRDKASGHHNMVVIHPISALARKVTADIQQTFQQQFPHLLIESLPYFSSKMIWLLLTTFRFRQGSSHCRQTLHDFANRQQTYDAISGKLWQISLQIGDAMLKLDAVEQGVWCDKVLKKLSWSEVAHQYHLAGKKAVEDILIECAGRLLVLCHTQGASRNPQLQQTLMGFEE